MKIDWWTLGFQAVNVLVLMLVLRHFFWAPIAAIIGKRQQAAQQIVDDAAKQKAEAASAQADIAATRAKLAAEHDAILAASHTEADRTRAALLEQAKAHAAGLVKAAHDQIEADRQAAEKRWAEHASSLAIDIARHLAARLEGPAVRAAFLDWLLAAIAALPQATRQSLAAEGSAIDAVSATALSPEEQAAAAALIGKAFGAHPNLAFRVDPAIIAGLELHAPHLTVGNSWQADLATIAAELAHAG